MDAEEIINLREHKERARVHFIPDLKVGVFVTLRAPDVIKRKEKRDMFRRWKYLVLQTVDALTAID